MKYILTVLTILMTMNQLSAQVIITDRPDQTESSATVGKGNLQIETGLEVGYRHIANTTIRDLALPTSLFRIGLADKLELRIGSSINTMHNIDKNLRSQGISDLELGLKYEVFTSKSGASQLALMSHVIFPTGSTIFSANAYASSSRIAFSQTLNDRFATGINVGYDFETIDKGNLTYSVVLGYSVNDHVGIYIEGYGEKEYQDWYQLNADAGITYLLKENLQLDFSFGIGEYMNYFATGVSWRIDR